MTKYSLNYLSFFILLIFSSCATLPIYQSRSLNEPTKATNTQVDYFNKEFNVLLDVSNNKSDLYLHAIFKDRLSMMQIMRNGLAISIDPEGKKGTDYQLKIEKTPNQMDGLSMQSRQKRPSTVNQQGNIPKMISKLYNKVTWDKKGDEFVFYRGLMKYDIDVDLKPNQYNELVLNIKLPLSEIPLAANQTIFSIGIENGTKSTSSMNTRRPSGAMHSGGGRSGRGGGNGMRSGGMGGGMRTGKAAGAGSASNTTPLRIWFQVEI